MSLLKYFSKKRKMLDVDEEDSQVTLLYLGRGSRFLAMPRGFKGKKIPSLSKICNVSCGYYNILMFLLVVCLNIFEVRELSKVFPSQK